MGNEKEQRLTSKSQMRMFETCPAQWNFQYKIRALKPEVVSGPLVFGNDVHNGIAKYYEEIDEKQVQYVTKDTIRESLTRHLINIKGDMERIENIINNMVTFEWNRFNKYGHECFVPIVIEKTYEIPPFRGIIDIAFLAKPNSKDVIVTDWKTGQYNPSEWDNDGMTIYSYFMTKEGYNVVEASTFFVEHGMKTLNVIDYNSVGRKAENFFNKTTNPNYFFPKKHSWVCKWCPYVIICYYEDDKEFRVEVIPETEKALHTLELMRSNGYA